MGDSLSERVERALGAAVVETDELDGGMVGSVYRVDLDGGETVVAKTSEHSLTTEGRMLRYLADESDLPVPAVRYVDDDLLVLEHVAGESTITPAVERDAAIHLADLHRIEGRACGFPFDTLTGPVPQPNPWTDDWIAFYRDQRVRPHLRRAADGALPASMANRVEAACGEFDALLAEPDHPALLHGDVWRTNLLTDGERITAFLDPACYYGHPAVELAYIDWTETFGDPFFERYAAERGADLAGFFDRRRFAYRLAPLLVHVHLFGEEYLPVLDESLDRLGC
ncbi:MAG: fructosamine kinase family protein [Haloarculaceae archaeon]